MTKPYTFASAPKSLPAFEKFAKALEARINEVGQYGEHTISLMYGRKYARIVATYKNGQRSSWGFIALNSGDVYKSDSWAKPAKHVRGNIFKWLVSGDLKDAGITSTGWVRELR